MNVTENSIFTTVSLVEKWISFLMTFYHNRKFPLIVAFTFFGFSIVQAQSSSNLTHNLNGCIVKLIKANKGMTSSVVTNRNVYLAGERLWFKAFAVNTLSGRPGSSDRNLFVDLLSDKDSLIQQLVLNNADIKTAGAFNTSANLPTGIYWIRAYTAKQIGKNEDEIFLHPLYIVNKNSAEEKLHRVGSENKTSSENTKLHFRFFAERLTTKSGILSTGAIEIRDENYKPVEVDGKLLNNKDSVIASFKTNALGLARLTYVNDPGQNFFVMVGNWGKFTLPNTNKIPVQLSVIKQSDNLFKAFVTIEETATPDMQTKILALHGDSICFASVGSGNYGISIPVDNFPGGITNLILFDDKDNFLTERSIYIPKENVFAEIILDKSQYKKREKVNAHIKIRKAGAAPLVALLSVSVEEEWISKLSDSLDAFVKPNSNSLFLSSWLYQNHNKYSTDDIDLLMLAKKRQPVTEAEYQQNGNDFDSNEKLLSLSGKIINRKGVGLPDRVITAISRNTSNFFIDMDTTDRKGAFKILLPQGFDSLRMSLQVADKSSRVLEDSVQINAFQFPSINSTVQAKQKIYNGNLQALYSFEKYFNEESSNFRGRDWLPNITVKSTKKVEFNYDVSKRINSISQIITRDKFRFGGADAIGNAVLMTPGVSLFNNDIAIFGPGFDLLGHVTKPLLVVDGVVVGNESILGYLNGLSPADIDFIEVLRGAEAGIYGIRGGAGVVSVNTRHTEDKMEDVTGKAHIVTPVTYHVNPPFSMPDYTNAELKESENPDPRTAIYWNGDLITDKNGEVDFYFFTGDEVGNYVVTLNGITGTGEMVYKRILLIGRK